jgi:cytochrome c oxidase subunit 2
MRGTIIVETPQEFDAWIASKKPQYLVANPQLDPSVPRDTTAPKPVASLVNGK